MPRFIVDVMLKPEILDPQGQAITQALSRIGVSGVTSVRQGKRFELDSEGDLSNEQIEQVAASLLANTVIEDFTVHRL